MHFLVRFMTGAIFRPIPNSNPVNTNPMPNHNLYHINTCLVLHCTVIGTPRGVSF